MMQFFRRLVREQPLGTVGGIIVLLLLLCGIFADVLARYGMNEIHLIDRYAPPSWTIPAGCRPARAPSSGIICISVIIEPDRQSGGRAAGSATSRVLSQGKLQRFVRERSWMPFNTGLLILNGDVAGRPGPAADHLVRASHAPHQGDSMYVQAAQAIRPGHRQPSCAMCCPTSWRR